MEVLELAGIGEIKVRRSANIKYLRIRMAPGRGVWVSVPFGVSRKQVEKFLEENREWILKNRKDMKVYEEDTGVGLGIGAEIKTKLHVLRIVGPRNRSLLIGFNRKKKPCLFLKKSISVK